MDIACKSALNNAAISAEEASTPAQGLVIASLGTALGSEGAFRGRVGDRLAGSCLVGQSSAAKGANPRWEQPVGGAACLPFTGVGPKGSSGRIQEEGARLVGTAWLPLGAHQLLAPSAQE
ncbi:MAG: hypothetical protein FRX49_12340 [Trebouxia sp. A1-2]|nr:MAG: hypothetical protein FRX49_12340 [Trebouxia sp. A1-2]